MTRQTSLRNYAGRAAALAGFALLLTGTAALAGPKTPRHPRPMPRVNLPSNLSDPNAQDLLQRMLEAENSLALTGDQVTTVARGGLDVSSEQQIMRDGARALRIDYVRPQQLAGNQIIDDGHSYCRYNAAKDTLEISPSKIGRLHVRVPQVIQQIQSGKLIVQWVGQDMVAGRQCGVVQVNARSATPVPWRRFWIDPANGAQLRIQEYDADGTLQSDSYYTQVAYNPTFDVGTFHIPHAGKEVVAPPGAGPGLSFDQAQQQAGFALLQPGYLPDGFKFQTGAISNFKGQKIAGLRYFNGVTILSVFEMSDTPDAMPKRFERPRRNVLIGHQGALKIILVGNLGDAEMQKIMASLR